MRFQHHAAHAQRFGLGQPEKFWLAFAFFGGELEIDMAVDVDRAFHHVVVETHVRSFGELTTKIT
ncbi:hypothetical protein D3C83_248670 [compost metagenome]